MGETLANSSHVSRCGIVVALPLVNVTRGRLIIRCTYNPSVRAVQTGDRTGIDEMESGSRDFSTRGNCRLSCDSHVSVYSTRGLCTALRRDVTNSRARKLRRENREGVGRDKCACGSADGTIHCATDKRHCRRGALSEEFWHAYALPSRSRSEEMKEKTIKPDIQPATDLWLGIPLKEKSLIPSKYVR